MKTLKTSIEFNIKKTIQYWLDGAEYDLSTATAMLEKEKYPYALFMGHLALEKLLKALVVKTSGNHAPYTHSLPLLAEKTKLKIPKKIIKALARFMEFHLEARYPDDQNKFYQKCTKAFTTRNLKNITEVYIWLKNQLNKQ
jgi:HEPN domain-containing protein